MIHLHYKLVHIEVDSSHYLQVLHLVGHPFHLLGVPEEAFLLLAGFLDPFKAGKQEQQQP